MSENIENYTKDFLIIVDEAHQMIDATPKTTSGKSSYKYVKSLALCATLMYAHASAKIVFMTATSLHSSGLGGVGPSFTPFTIQSVVRSCQKSKSVRYRS